MNTAALGWAILTWFALTVFGVKALSEYPKKTLDLDEWLAITFFSSIAALAIYLILL